MATIEKPAVARSPRRMFLALLGAVPALAANLSAPSRAETQDPDFHLLRLVEAWHEAGKCTDWGKYQEQIALREQALRTIACTPAKTARGALAKARMCIECTEVVMHSHDTWRELAKGTSVDSALLHRALS